MYVYQYANFFFSNRRILFNMIDTPGHIDFSTEVGAALRVCDGAIILVDLAEGCCVQTRESIKKAFEEHTKMILVLNKFDRLIIELKKEVDDIFQGILRIIEDCNAIVAELYQYEFTTSEVDIEDTGLLFSPETGNVIFASAIDGWGFTTKQIARMFVDLVKEETVESLNQKLWNFDCYIDSKKEIKTGAIDKGKTNLFVQFCLKTIVHVYETLVVRMERDKANTIINKLDIKNITRDMTHSDPKVQVRSILQAWKPIATTILLQCLKEIPPPCNIPLPKIEYLLSVNRYCEDQYLNKCVQDILPHFKNLQQDSTAPVIGYVSKMFCVNKKNLSQNKAQQFVLRPRNQPQPQPKETVAEETNIETVVPETIITYGNDEIAVIALARVFSGVLKIGQELYALTGSYTPDKVKIEKNPDEFVANNRHVQKVVIKELYMLFGRELLLVDSIPAGNFCGIGGVETNILRTATLSSSLSVVPITERTYMDPVVRHAVEPANPKDLPILRNGLKLLMQSDSAVEAMMQETGELVLLTAGDVHLGKCIEDLTKFTKIEVQVSRPMVALRETIINEADFREQINNYELVETTHFQLSLIAVTAPQVVIEIVKNNFELLKMVERHLHKSFIDIVKTSVDQSGSHTSVAKSFKSEVTTKALSYVKEQLQSAFDGSGDCWKGLHNKIWSVGSIKDCINLLINNTPDYNHSLFLEPNYNDKRALFDNFVVNAFNMFCKNGPLCEEPVMNCAFIINKFELIKEVNPEEISPQITSAIESAVKFTFKKAFEKQEPQLMEPIYITEIQVNTNILGKVYKVVGKRHGKVIEDVGMDDQEKTFMVRAQIPVVESEGFASEMRKTTSGQANPILRFSHYEVVEDEEDVDEDDDEEEEENKPISRAQKLCNDVRRRKGLLVDEEVVVHAEKQRTLSKKK